MAPPMAIFSRRKHFEDKKLPSPFSTQRSASPEREKCGAGALVSISSPLAISSKPIAVRGENSGLVHAPRPRASSNATGRAFCCMSRVELEVKPSQEKKVNRSISQPVSMKMIADMRRSPVSNSATTHLDSSSLLPYPIRVTKLPGSPMFQEEKPLPLVDVANNLPAEPLLPVSASSPETYSSNSPTFTGRAMKKPSRPRPVGIISLRNYEFNHYADTSVAPLNVKKKNGEENDIIVEIASPRKPFLMKDEMFPKLDPILQSQGLIPPTDLQRRNQEFLQRIQELEKANCERDLSLSRHASKFQALRQSHAALVETMRISYEAEISSLSESIKSMDKTKCVNLASNEELMQLRKREKELTRLVKEKDEELEVAKKDVNELRGKLADVEKLVARGDGELGRRMEGMSEQMVVPGRVEFTNTEEDVATLAAKLAEESQLKEKVEKESDALVLKHSADLVDALATGRAKDEERQRQVLEEEKEVEEYKCVLLKGVEDILREEEEIRTAAPPFSQEQLESRIQQEETRDAEVVADFKAKLLELEIARKVDLGDFEAQMKIKQEAEQVLISKNMELKSRIINLQRLLDKDKDAIESLKNSHRDIMRIAKRINGRLTEEKRKNKSLGGATPSLSSHSACPNTPNEDSEEVSQLELLGDQDGKVEVLKTENNALKVQLKSVDEVHGRCSAKAKVLQDALAGKNLKIEELESLNAELTEILQSYQKEFGQLKESATSGKGPQTDRREDGLGNIIVKAKALDSLIADYTIEEYDGEPSAGHSHLFEQLLQAQSALAEANKEIQLYELDVKGYKKDVRRRDAQITTLNKQVIRLQSLLHGASLLEIKALRDDVQLGCHKSPPTTPANVPSTTSHHPAGKVNSVKNQNLHLHQKVGKKGKDVQNAIESRDWVKKMLQCSEQRGLVIRDLELKVEKLQKEKERAEEKTRSALMKMAEMKGVLTPLPLPPPTEDGARLTDSTLTTSHDPTPDAQPTASISITSKPSHQGSSHSRTRSGWTHSRPSSKDVASIYTVSPVNTSIPPPRFPSPTTPLPPIPPEIPSQSPVAASPTGPRPSTASSDDGLPPLGVLSSPLMVGLHKPLPSAEPRSKKLGSAAILSSADGEKDNGKRLGAVLGPPDTLKVAKRNESPKDTKHEALPTERMTEGERKHDVTQLLAEVMPYGAEAPIEAHKVQDCTTSRESEEGCEVIYW